ncbi:MAG: SRPBCC family protein [Pseudomonadota bacterium]
MNQSESYQVFRALCRRLHENVSRQSPDLADDILSLPASNYDDPEQFQREIDRIFLQVPLLVALSCDIPAPGDFHSINLAGRPLLIVRGDDQKARVFFNICRHRGAALTDQACGHARLFVCPYHAWSYDRNGKLRGISDAQVFGKASIDGLIELPSDENAGVIFCTLTPGQNFDLGSWLGDMLPALESLRLADMFPYRKTSTLASPNWKLAADGYLDGYHLGYLHRNNIGLKSITNRNTYDIFGPHVRVGFANKGIHQIKEKPEADWNLSECMSLVHYIFPNVSISGGHHDTIQLSRLFPGPSVNESTTIQHQYFRQPVEGRMVEAAEEKRILYEQVVRDEDCKTVFEISDALPAMADMPIIFGRNESGNQALHKVIRAMTEE